MNLFKGIFGLAAALSAIMFSCSAAKASTVSYEFKTYIDGEDILHIQGDELYWTTQSWTPVGDPRYDVPSTTTDVTTRVDGSIVHSFDWQPVYPPGTPTDFATGSTTYSVTGLTPSLPAAPTQVTLNILQGRGPVSIAQSPDAGNGYSLGIDFNDNIYGGAALYDVEVSYQTPSTVPLPGAFSLLAFAIVGSAGLAFAKRR